MEMKGESPIHIKSYAFALRTVKLYQYLTEKKKEFTLSKQFLRSGTAVGALVKESKHAESRGLILFINYTLHLKKLMNPHIGWICCMIQDI